jgi:hypothetical protein
MALYFDDSSFARFPNPLNETTLGPSAIVALFKPEALDAGAHQYILAQASDGDTTLGGLSVAIPFNTDQIRAFLARDSSKFNDTTSSPIIWSRWYMVIISNYGSLTDTGNPRIYIHEFPSSTLQAQSLSSTAGSGSFVSATGSWTIGAYVTNSNWFLGDIEYVAFYSGISLRDPSSEGGTPFSLMRALLGGASPLNVAPKYLKFFVPLHDPNNIIDIISGRKAGIGGTLIKAENSPHINYY